MHSTPCDCYQSTQRSTCNRFKQSCGAVFTLRELEKTPLTLVPAEPYELLDKTRYDFCSKELGNGKDYQVDLLLDNLLQSCRMRGMEASLAHKPWPLLLQHLCEWETSKAAPPIEEVCHAAADPASSPHHKGWNCC